MRMAIMLFLLVISCRPGFCQEDRWAFPKELPPPLRPADSLLTAGDSAKGLAEYRTIASTIDHLETAARALYNIGEWHGRPSASLAG